MAITRNQATLADSQLNSTTQITENNNIDTSHGSSRASGFIGSTINELKKVEWPTLRYVLNWSAVIICFSALFAVSLGFFDHVFTGSIKFVDCTSTGFRNEQTDKQKKLGECSQQLGEYIAFKSK